MIQTSCVLVQHALWSLFCSTASLFPGTTHHFLKSSHTILRTHTRRYKLLTPGSNSNFSLRRHTSCWQQTTWLFTHWEINSGTRFIPQRKLTSNSHYRFVKQSQFTCSFLVLFIFMWQLYEVTCSPSLTCITQLSCVITVTSVSFRGNSSWHRVNTAGGLTQKYKESALMLMCCWTDELLSSSEHNITTD